MRPSTVLFATLASLLLLSACGGGGGDSSRPRVSDSPLIVDTLLDDPAAPADSLTLRQALATRAAAVSPSSSIPVSTAAPSSSPSSAKPARC